MSRSVHRLLALLLMLPGLVVPFGQTRVCAAGLGVQADQFASGRGNELFLVAGAVAPLLEDGRNGRNHTLRVVDALGASVLMSEALKWIVREKRPDGSDRESFPSGHATAAFAVAAVESLLHPRQAALWYGGAGLIGASRVGLHRHYIHDVLAGGLLGYATGRWEVSRSHGIILRPLIGPDRSGLGLEATKRF